MKAVKINLAGRVRYLAFTGEAMFQMRDKFGGTSQLLEDMKADTREGFSIACEAAAILAEQGELVRRNFGYDPERMPTTAEIAATSAPSEIVALKLAIPAAISLGYGREVEPENDEVDLGLAELNTQKKRGNADRIPPGGHSGGLITERRPPHASRGSGRPFRALPPGPGGAEENGTGGRITPEGRPPPAENHLRNFNLTVAP